jgi:ribosomal protein S18 acetylase RimI-like enzyme
MHATSNGNLPELTRPSEITSTFRRGSVADAESLAVFAARLYVETFGAATSLEDLAQFLDRSYGPSKQAAELSDPAIITILGESGAELSSYAQVRRHSPPPFVTGERPVELWRFYVDRRWHGRGVADALMSEVQSAARELKGASLWLSVWERNTRAIAFYTRFGFRDVGSQDFWVGSDRQIDRILQADVPRLV